MTICFHFKPKKKDTVNNHNKIKTRSVLSVLLEHILINFYFYYEKKN